MCIKNLLCILLLMGVAVANLQAQCAPNSPGFLSGTTSNILATDTTATPIYTTAPSGLPNTEFIILQQDSIADDELGAVILTSSLDGRVVPADFGLSTCNEICVVPFSYDLVQLQTVVDSLINGEYIPGTSCCSAAGQFFVGLCDSLATYGINSGADVSNLNDVITFMGIFAGTNNSSISLTGFIGTIQQINTFAGLFGNCAGNNSEICFAISNTPSAMDCYRVALPNSANFVDIMQDTVRIPANGTVNLIGTYLPNSSMDTLNWSIANSGSSLVINATTGEVTASTSVDTAWVVVKAIRGCATDTAVVIVDPALTIAPLKVTNIALQVHPNPFKKHLTLSLQAQPGEFTIQLVSVTGQVIFQEEYFLSSGNQRIDIQDASIPKGYYFLKVIGKDIQGTQAVVKY